MNKKIKYGIFSVGALGLGIALFFIIRKIIRLGDMTDLPKETDWGASLTDTESNNAARIAENLYNDMKGINIFSRDMAVYNEYLGCDDRTFVATANYFYKKYGNGENLAQWINGENFTFTNLNSANETAKKIIERLAKFNIHANK